jgi:hypothetical protein
MLGLHGFVAKFAALYESEREGVRATSVFLLGSSNDVEVVRMVERPGEDLAPLVREQAMFALIALVRGIRTRESKRNARQYVAEVANPMLKNLIASVKARGFQERCCSNIFFIPSDQ